MIAVFLVGAFLGFASHADALLVITNGTGSVPCGNNTYCAPNAVCSANLTCECSNEPDVMGNHGLCCHRVDEYSTHVINDPILKLYNNIHVNLALPCRYQLTKFTTNLIRDGENKGQCNFEIRPFNGKQRGKFYTRGYDLAVKIIHSSDATLWQYSVRKEGVAVAGEYYYQINATEDMFTVDGPFADDRISLTKDGITVVDCHVDEIDNYAIANLSYCGVKVVFRAFDIVELRNQSFTPGLSVVIDDAFNPYFPPSDELSLALSPADPLSALYFNDAFLNSTKNAGVTDRFLVHGDQIPQNNPDGNMACYDASLNYQNCTSDANKTAALTNCLWLFTAPKFIHCFDNSTNGYPIMDLFSKCVAGFCGGVDMCDEFQTTALNVDCTNTMNYIQLTTAQCYAHYT